MSKAGKSAAAKKAAAKTATPRRQVANSHPAGAGTPVATHPLIDPQAAGPFAPAAVEAAQANQNERVRRRVSTPHEPGTGRAIPDPATEVKVKVNVPHFFKLQSDDRIMYDYGPGEQMMPKSHADHEYARDNGVTLVK